MVCSVPFCFWVLWPTLFLGLIWGYPTLFFAIPCLVGYNNESMISVMVSTVPVVPHKAVAEVSKIGNL